MAKKIVRIFFWIASGVAIIQAIFALFDETAGIDVAVSMLVSATICFLIGWTLRERKQNDIEPHEETSTDDMIEKTNSDNKIIVKSDGEVYEISLITHCSECGFENSVDNNFCLGCGTPLNIQQLQSHPPEPEASQCPAPEATQYDKKYKSSILRVNHESGFDFVGSGAKVDIALEENHIRFCPKSMKKSNITLNYSQIVNVEVINEKEIIASNRSVIARGLAGGVFGPVSAILGGISGLGSNKKKKE